MVSDNSDNKDKTKEFKDFIKNDTAKYGVPENELEDVYLNQDKLMKAFKELDALDKADKNKKEKNKYTLKLSDHLYVAKEISLEQGIPSNTTDLENKTTGNVTVKLHTCCYRTILDSFNKLLSYQRSRTACGRC